MDPMWLVVRYLLDRAACRARAALRGEPESGALSLEWIVIAVAVVAAAGIAAGLFEASIRRAAGKLP